MKKNEILRIEEELSIKLPDRYIKVVLKHPFKNRKKYDAIYNTLLNDAAEIININKKIREKGIQNKKWPNHFYIIGHRSFQHFYFIDLATGRDERIFFLETSDKFNPKNIDKLKVAYTLKEFIKGQKVFQKIFDNP